MKAPGDFVGVDISTRDVARGIEVRATFRSFGISIITEHDVIMWRGAGAGADAFSHRAHKAAVAAVAHGGLSAWAQLHGRLIVLGTEFYDAEKRRYVVSSLGPGQIVRVTDRDGTIEETTQEACLDALARGKWSVDP